MHIKFHKGCFDTNVTIGGKKFEDCTQIEIKEAIINMMRTEQISKERMIELIQVFGDYTDGSDCDQCDDSNYEIIWK